MGIFKKKKHPTPPAEHEKNTFSDEDLGIPASEKEEESVVLENRRAELSREWHNERAIVTSPRMLDIITNDLLKKRQRAERMNQHV